MKIEDIKIGMKVKIPKTKSVEGNILYSVVVNAAKAKNQDFLFITGKVKQRLLLNSSNDVGGDYFLAKDLEPYEEDIAKVIEDMTNDPVIKEMWYREYKDSQENYTQPPIGLTPKVIHNINRVNEIKAAITRYAEVDKEIPIKWIEEYNELTKSLKDSKL